MSDTDGFSDLEILALTIYGEARGELLDGQMAIANVIFNRVDSGITWWGTSVRAVCLMPYQFSCWLAGDPNRPKLLAVTGADAAYAGCMAIATEALYGTWPADNTSGADSYLRTGTLARWARGLTPVAVIGHHSFFITMARPRPLPPPAA